MFRPAAVAGSFYPSDPAELKQCLAGFLTSANPPKVEGRLRALIVPHAGYIYSGPIAGFSYSLISNIKYQISKFVLLGPSHTVGFPGVAMSTASEWETPLGRVKTWKPEGIGAPFFDFDLAHEQEHCLEVQLPFLQTLYPEGDFKIFPALVGEVEAETVAQELEKVVDEETIMIVSSDLSHYQPYKQAVLRDKETLDAIVKKQLTVLETQGDACGLTPIIALVRLAQKHKWQAQLLDYRNSGDTAGDKSRVVGYGAVAFTS